MLNFTIKVVIFSPGVEEMRDGDERNRYIRSKKDLDLKKAVGSDNVYMNESKCLSY